MSSKLGNLQGVHTFVLHYLHFLGKTPVLHMLNLGFICFAIIDVYKSPGESGIIITLECVVKIS